MHHSLVQPNYHAPTTYLTSRPAPQQRREMCPTLAMAAPQRPMLGSGFPDWSPTHVVHGGLAASHGNIYAEVEQEYEVDSGFTEESSDLTSASLYSNHPPRRMVKPKLHSLKRPSQSANAVYSSDDSEQDHVQQKKPDRNTKKKEERGRHEGQCLVHSFYTVNRDLL